MRPLISLFGLTIASLVIAGVAVEGDASCDGCNDKLSRELEKVNKDFSRCRANHLAIETRESILKEQIASCDEQRKSGERTAADLESKLDAATKQQTKDRDNFQTERDALLQMVNSLKQNQKDLQEKYDAAVQEHRAATETQQLRHAQQLELIMSHNTKLEAQLDETADAKNSMEEANKLLNLKIDDLEQEKVAAVENADQWKSKFSQDHSSCEVSLSNLQQKLEEARKEQARELASTQSSCESQKKDIEEEMKQQLGELQSTIDQLQQSHVRETRSLHESYNATIMDQQSLCDSKIAQLEGLNQQMEATMKSTVSELKEDCQTRTEDLQKNMKAEIDEALQNGIELGKNMTSTGLQRMKKLSSKLRESQRSLMEQTENDAVRLRKVQDELFEVRRELFFANEKLREPAIRHRTRMKRVRAVIDVIVETISPFHYTYVVPLWVPVYRYIMKAVAYFQREHLPEIQSKATIVMAASADLFDSGYRGILHSYEMLKGINSESILNATTRERKLASDAWIGLRTTVYDDTLLPFYQQTINPAVSTHWLPIYRKHMLPLWNQFTVALSPHLKVIVEHWRLALHYHGVMQGFLVEKLYEFADVMSDYGHVQKYELLAHLFESVRDNSAGLVNTAESILAAGIILTPLLLIMRGRRKPQKTV